MQEADLAYGNLEFSMNGHPELQRPFYNFRAPPEFAWEVAAIGINLVSMANNFGYAFSPSISGWLQVKYGFAPVFAWVLILYTISVYLYWKFFWHAKTAMAPYPAPAD